MHTIAAWFSAAEVPFYVTVQAVMAVNRHNTRKHTHTQVDVTALSHTVVACVIHKQVIWIGARSELKKREDNMCSLYF